MSFVPMPNSLRPKVPSNAKLHRALENLRTGHIFSEEKPFDTIIAEALRMEAALSIYAQDDNYIDGVPQREDGEGELVDDLGRTARVALRLADWIGEPLVVLAEALAEHPPDAAPAT